MKPRTASIRYSRIHFFNGAMLFFPRSWEGRAFPAKERMGNQSPIREELTRMRKDTAYHPLREMSQ
jgi:hypothetical protein